MAEINKSFRVNKGISLQDEVGIFYSTNDPAATSEVAPEGSLLLQKNSGSGVLWIKTGVTDTAWKRLSELSLGDLEDVSISSIATNQLIRWNGSNFENATVSLNDLDGILSLVKGGLGSNVSGFDGTLIISGGTASSIKNNYSATSAPTGAHDSSAGYAIGSNWINISSGTAYICVDASIGAAVWTSSSAGSFSLDADSGTSQTIEGGDTLTISGTANAIDTVVGATNTVTIDISNSYSGQTSITTLGTVSTGTWQGTTIAVDQGGTGQISYTNGQLLIGNTTGNTLSLGTLASADSSITITNGTGTIDLAVNDANVDHGSIGGLTDDDHTQYALLSGRSGGQTLIGGTAASNTLTLQSTSDATRGTINIVDNVIIGGGTSPSELRLLEGSASGTNYTGFKSPTTLSSNVVYELPSASGTDGQVMAWSSGDVMEWTDRVSSSATNKVTTISVVSTLPGTPDANTLYFVMSA